MGCGEFEQVRTFRRRGEHYIGKNSLESVKQTFVFDTHLMDSRGLSISSSDVSNFIELALQSKSSNLSAEDYGLDLNSCSNVLQEHIHNRNSRDAQLAKHYGFLPDEFDLNAALKSFIQGTRRQPPLMEPFTSYTVELHGSEFFRAVVRKGQPWFIANKGAKWQAYNASLSEAAAKLFPEERDKTDIRTSQSSLTMSQDFYDELLNVMVQRKLRASFEPPKPYQVAFTAFPESSMIGFKNFVWTYIKKDVENPAVDLVLWKTFYYDGVLKPDWAEFQASAEAAERCAGGVRWFKEWRPIS